MDNKGPEILPPVNPKRTTSERAEAAGHGSEELSKPVTPEAIKPNMDTPGSTQPADDNIAQQDQTQTVNLPLNADQHNDTAKSLAPTQVMTPEPDKVWVKRAKRIVEETRHDPHTQSERIVALKRDYQEAKKTEEDKAS